MQWLTAAGLRFLVGGERKDSVNVLKMISSFHITLFNNRQ